MSTAKEVIAARYQEQERLVLALYKQDKRGDEMRAALGVSRGTLSNITKRLGIRLRTTWVSTDQIRCRTCFEAKHRDEFYKTTSGHEYSRCKRCCGKRFTTGLNTAPERFFKYKISEIKAAAKRKSVPFTITHLDLAERYAAQRGLCFYTDDTLELRQHTKGGDNFRSVLSVDKVVPSGGYVPGNVVLCTHLANTVKNDLTLAQIAAWLPGWYERIQKFELEDFVDATAKLAG